jgi:hypothetical protein
MLLAGIVSCGGGSTMLLKPPLVMGCQRAGLPRCPAIADGVIQYIDGDKDKARVTIRDALLGLNPEQVRTLLTVLKSLPSSDALNEVIALIEGGPDTATSSSSPGGTARSSAASSSIDPAFTHLRASTVIVPGNPSARTCSTLVYESAPNLPSVCLSAVTGPILVTDVEWLEGCPVETFALAGDTDQPIWFLRTEAGHGLSVHGASLFVPSGTTLTLGHRSAGPLTPNVACAITWAGRRP